MRVLCPVVETLMSAMLDRGHHLVFRGAVARQLVRDHDTRGPALLFQQLAEQALGGLFVPPALDQAVAHDPILVDGPPQPVLLAADHQAHFVQVPLVSRTGEPAADLVGEALAELARPLAPGFMAHVNAAGRQHLFDHAQAQRKAEVEPNGVADDLARKAIAGVGGLGCGGHAGHLPVPALPAKPRPKLTVPGRAPRRCFRSKVFAFASASFRVHGTRLSLLGRVRSACWAKRLNAAPGSPLVRAMHHARKASRLSTTWSAAS